MRALLLDTHSLFFRAFYGLPKMTTRSGFPTQALYGFSSLFLKLLREYPASPLAFASDLPDPTFRHLSYPSYKAQRDSTPAPLRTQIEELPELLVATDLPHFSIAGFEADDVLATLAYERALAGDDSLVVSGDRDLLQLAAAHCEVLFLGRRGRPAERYDADRVRDRFGVEPYQLPALIALAGDPRDNLPKVEGIGQRTASRLVAEHGNIADLLAALPALKPGKIKQALEGAAARLPQMERLATLRCDVPLGPGPRTGVFSERSKQRLATVFRRWEFRTLLARLDAIYPANQVSA